MTSRHERRTADIHTGIESGMRAVLTPLLFALLAALGGCQDANPVFGPLSEEVQVAGDGTDTAPLRGDYPNMPAGLTILGQSEGSSGGTSEPHAFGIADFSRFLTANGEVTVVDDATNPTRTGKSLRFRWAQGGYGSGAGKATMPSFPGGPVDELYIMMRLYMEPGGWDFGHKFFYIGTPDVENPPNAGFYIDRPGGGDPQELRIIYDNSMYVAGTDRTALRQGEWLNIEFHLVGGRGNGQAHVWINGDLVAESSGIDWTNQFDGLQWYAMANEVKSESAYRIGELMIAGRR